MPSILSTQFGDDLVASLRTLAGAVESLARPPGPRPRVLIVPGLPGTMLGTRRPILDDVVWFNPVAIAEGRITELAVDPASPPLEALEALPAGYLKLKLRLQLAGYDIDDYPFDWRLSLDELGPQLAERLTREGREVHLVSHSFGGLVCRAAIAAGAPNVGKIIMLAPPNHGTFTVVQGIRGSHWLLRALATLDRHHTADDLAVKVFSTFPSVYEQLPTRAVFDALDLYDPATWPTGPGPRSRLLTRAPGVQDWIARARGRLHVIAGYGTPTVDGVSPGDGGLRYSRSTDGDGWVPAAFAMLDGAPTYFTTAPHAATANDDTVIGAVEDLLAGDTTSKLPRSRPAGARLPDQSNPALDGPDPFTAADVEDAMNQLLAVAALRGALAGLAG